MLSQERNHAPGSSRLDDLARTLVVLAAGLEDELDVDPALEPLQRVAAPPR